MGEDQQEDKEYIHIVSEEEVNACAEEVNACAPPGVLFDWKLQSLWIQQEADGFLGALG